ncbi:phage holin family protein [Povalibacter uvarum]|nr:phage holin family protein [Povalibacter uvarum]
MDGMSPDRDPAPVTGLFQSLSNFVATLVAIAHTRLQLLTTELQEEVQQVAQMLIWSFIALFAAMMALFLGALTIIFAFWDTHRILAALLTTFGFLLIAIVGGLVLQRKLAAKPPMLDATLAELAKDRDQLRARL